MSRIDDLIAENCADGVEYRLLGEVGEFIRGNGLQKKDLRADGMGAIHYGQVFTTYGTSTRETVSFVDPVLGAKSRRAAPGDLVVAATSENDEDVCKAVAWVGDQEIAVSSDAFVYRHRLDPLYVAYFFQSQHFQSQKRRFISGTKVRRVSGSDLGRIVIPVPPLDIQREVAEILDSMERLKKELEVELEAELDALRRQIGYYRDLLVGEAGSSRRRYRLADIATFKYGYTAKAQATGDLRFIRITDISELGRLRPDEAKYVPSSPEAQEYLVHPGDLLMARTGGTYGKCMLVSPGAPAVYASFLIRIQVDQSVVRPDYYWHFAQSSHYWRQAEGLVSQGGQPQFNANALRELVLSVPPLQEQARIVKSLDRLDALVNELASSLPGEIAARRKQYEFYRERLLAFPERVA